MKATGNSFGTIFKKLRFFFIMRAGKRSRFIKKHYKDFRHLGENIFWQSRYYPADPELISIGNNVNISADVKFINHDIVHTMLNNKFSTAMFAKFEGGLKLGIM